MYLGLELSLRAMSAIGGAINAYIAYAMADDFDNSSYWQTDTNAATSGTTKTAPSGLAGYTFTATGACYELNSDGTIAGPFAANVPAITDAGLKARQAFTNLLLNAGSPSTLATQTTAALTAVAHTISFIGTGSVALSGSFTGSLAGTGANNRVSLTFTPTAAALTVTVTGSVTYAELHVGTVAGPIITTTTAAATRGEALLKHNIFADGSILTDQDMLIWTKATPSEIATNQQAFDLTDGTVNNRILVWLSSGAVTGYVVKGSVLLYSPSVAGVLTAGTEAVLLIRRMSGAYRIGKYVSGVLTWGTETAALWPVNLTKATSGNAVAGTAPFRGTVDSAFIDFGTFATDAEVIAAITGAP